MGILKRWLDELKEEQAAKPSFFEKTAKKASAEKEREKEKSFSMAKAHLWVFIRRTRLEISMRARKGENKFEVIVPYETMEKVKEMMEPTSRHRAAGYLEFMVKEHIGDGFIVSVTTRFAGDASMRVYWPNNITIDNGGRKQ